MSDLMTEITVLRPAGGGEAGRCPIASVGDVAASAQRLRDAQPEWEALGPDGRAVWLGRFRDWILDSNLKLTELVQAESGKSWQDAAFEVPASVDAINFYTDRAGDFLADRTVRPHSPSWLNKRMTLTYRPHPLVGVITPWNFPLVLPIIDVVAALAAGCAVLSKPSEVTPLAWSEAVRGWREDLGAPEVLAVATGFGETGAAVVDVCDMIQFTGSTRTGRVIAMRCADRLIPCSLELGGKDAMIVLADADVERAAKGAVWGGFFNAGQCCISVERVFVEAAIYDEFVHSVVRNVAELRQGTDDSGISADVGAMATMAQLEIVERHVGEARAEGATIPTGGSRRAGDGMFFEPTVLTDVNPTMSCMRDETFGPTLPIMRVADADEAVALTNDSEYGLSASVWSKDRAKAEAIARRLDVGAVNINNVIVNAFQFGLPMGGWKASGIGARLGGGNGLLKYCRPKALVQDRIEPPTELTWYPYTARKAHIQSSVARFLGARGLKRRLGR